MFLIPCNCPGLRSAGSRSVTRPPVRGPVIRPMTLVVPVDEADRRVPEVPEPRELAGDEPQVLVRLAGLELEHGLQALFSKGEPCLRTLLWNVRLVRQEVPLGPRHQVELEVLRDVQGSRVSRSH